MRIRPAFGAVAISFLFLTLSSSHALANSLVTTSPTSGSSLSASPSAVTMTVESPLMDLGNEISVTDPSGSRVDDGTLTVAGTDVIVGMKEITKPGIYTVSYLLLSENDVPLQGTFTFNFSTPSVIVPQTIAPTTPTKIEGGNSTTNALVIGLLVLSLGVLIGLGLYARKIFSER